MSEVIVHHRNPGIVPTELVAQRTAFTKAYAVGPNRYEAFLSSIQIHALDREKHEWQEIDARFKPVGEIPGAKEAGIPDPVYASQGPALTAVCGNAGTELFLAIMDAEKHCLSWGIEKAQPVKPEIPAEVKLSEDEIGESTPAAISFLATQIKAQGAVRYIGVYPGVDYHCHTDGQLESVFVFHTPEAAREIVLLLKADGLKAQENKDQSIFFTDDAGEVIFRLCPPAVFDTAGDDGGVKVSMEEAGEFLRIVYTPDPGYMETATYPVILDPVIKTKGTSISVVDTFVSSAYPAANYSTHERIYASYSGSLTRYGFLRFDTLPALGSNHFITNAKLALKSIIKPSSTTAIYVREVTQSWVPADVTYNQMPAFNTSTILDYVKLYSTSAYTSNVSFDITALVRQWYQGTNYGVALTGCETSGSTGAFYSTDSSVSGKPYLQIEYASLAGLEDYLTYDATSAGKAGTGQVSLANGNLIFLHQDTAMNGARMPVSVTHVYNSCDADTDPFGCGFGWRTNFHQTLHKEFLDSTVYYVYTDGDGTEHWFKPTSSAATKYKDESGLSMELVPGNDSVTIRDKGDGILTFPVINETPTASNPVTGKVLISSIADACGNTITIYPVDGSPLKISSIRDGARTPGSEETTGRVTTFVYNASGMLVAIRTPWQAEQDTPEVQFTYADGCLTGIQYVDGNSSGYQYNQDVAQGATHHLLTHAVGPEGIAADFTYTNTNVISGLPHVVVTAKCWDGQTAIAGNTSYAYGANLCLVKDEQTGNRLRYHFNDNGNCTSVDDGLGYAVFAEYDQSGENADAPINHATSTSRIQRVVNNLLFDGLLNRTSGSPWTKVGTGTVEQAANSSLSGFGYYKRKFTVANGNTLYLRQTVTVEAGKTYTLSGYAQSLGPKAFLRVLAGALMIESIEIAPVGSETQTELERTQVTFTVPAGITSADIDLCATGTGAGTIVWWDSAQLEEGESANHVNLIENSQMNRTASSGLPNSWTADSNCASFLSWQERSGCSVAMPENLPGHAMHVAGRWNRSIRVFQTMRVNGKKGDKLTTGGWVSSYAKRIDVGGSVYCRLQIWFSTSNASAWTGWTFGGAVDFNHEEGNWQFACNGITAPIDYSWIRVAIYYNRQMNYADFSNLFLYKEQYGTDFVYDERGNRKKRTSTAGHTRGSTFDDYNNVLTSATTGRTVVTTNEWGTTEAEKRMHLLRRSVSPMGTVSTFQYDVFGNCTVSKVQENYLDTTKYFLTSTAYTAAGTYVASQTDTRGKTTFTETDPNQGTVSKVTDPSGQVVRYTYDTLRRPVWTKTPLNGYDVRTGRVYHSLTGYLTSVSHSIHSETHDGGVIVTSFVTYNFTYDSLGRQVGVLVGNNLLSTTAYDTVRQTVESVTFGPLNNPVGSVQYLYDTFSRVTGIRYDGAASNRFSYGYDAQGRVAYVQDHLWGTITYTDYDLAGRPCQKTRMQGTNHVYTGQLTYNGYDLPHQFTEFMGPARTRHTTTFGYDDENRVVTESFDGTWGVRYFYDYLGRLYRREVPTGIIDVPSYYEYEDLQMGNQASPLVTFINQKGCILRYTYDDRGNITAIDEDGLAVITYEYDAIGQLIRANDPYDTTGGAGGTTWIFAYDLGGNILSKTAYPFTTGAVGTAVVTHTYSYGATTIGGVTYGKNDWLDQLAALDGVGITYDAIGNPLNDGTWTYEWQHGRQLKRMYNATDDISFEYNEDGLRTKKTSTTLGETVYTLHGKNIVHMTNASHNIDIHFYYGSDGKPVVMNFNGTMYGLLYNVQGDVVALFNEDSDVTVRYRYGAWGELLNCWGPEAGTVGFWQPFRYRGYLWDWETGDYYCRSRQYRSVLGRFLNADSIITGNLFEYCNNAPNLQADPTGMDGYQIGVDDFISDQKGWAILYRWLFGDGSDWIISDDSSWTKYMTESPLCSESDCRMPLDHSVRNHVLHLVAQKVGAIQSGKSTNVSIVTHLSYQNGEGIKGYSYLHGTKDYVGGFEISASVIGFSDRVTIHALCTFNDVITPNDYYESDMRKAQIAYALVDPQDYRIQISWEMDYLVTYEEYASAMEDYDK